MSVKLYVGNLSFDTTEQELEALFSELGEVQSVNIISDRVTGRSRGFGFVEMATSASAESAIQRLNGSKFGGRALTVNEARAKVERGSQGGFSSDRRGRGGFGEGRSRNGGQRW